MAREAEPAGRCGPRSIVVAALAAAVLLALRFVALGADPPAWADSAFFLDGGWWASSARAEALWGDPTRIDVGLMHYLVPGYTQAMLLVFDALGEQTTTAARLLSACASTATALLAAACAFRLHGARGAALTALLLAASPMCWAHGRAELVAPLLALAAFVPVALLVWRPRGVVAPLVAGLALAAAFAIKGTAIYACIFPTLGALLFPLAVQAWRRRRGLDGSAVAWTPRTPLLVGAGLAAGLVAFYAVHVAPDADAYFRMARDISGRVDPRHALSIPGRTLISKSMVGGTWTAVAWRWMSHSPALFAAAWLLALGALSRVAARRTAGPRDVTLVGFVRLWCGLYALGMLLTPYQPDYRWLPLVAVIALAAPGVLLDPDGGAPAAHGAPIDTADDATFGRRRAWNLVALAVWTLPLFLAVRAGASNALADALAGVKIGVRPGVSVFVASTIIVAGWGGLLLVVAPVLRGAFRWSVRGRVAAGVVAALVLVEVGVVGAHLARPEFTQADAQRRLAELLPRDAQVGGAASGSLLSGTRAVPVRRVTPATEALPVQSDDWGDRRPGRFLVVRVLDHAPTVDYAAERAYLDAHEWTLEGEFAVGESDGATRRYEVELWRRP